MWDHTTHVDIIAPHNKILQQNVHLMLMMISKDENNSVSRIWKRFARRGPELSSCLKYGISYHFSVPHQLG